MERLEKYSWAKNYSHIYIERGAEDYPLTKAIVSKYQKAQKIFVDDFKRVFNRPRQDIFAQKNSVKLLVAKKRPPFFYPISANCQNFGHKGALYTTPVLGCLFDCDYCFLHGMINTANIVVFVNTSDFFEAAKKELAVANSERMPLLINISYETDLMALEKIFGLCKEWLDFARSQENVLVECRTKSAIKSALASEEPLDRFILAWSLSPDSVIKKYENRTPTLGQRLGAIKAAIDAGWRVRLCFDPVVPFDGFEEEYKSLFSRVFSEIPTQKVRDVAIGPFRMGKTYFKRIKKQRPNCDLYYNSRADGISKIDAVIEKELKRFIAKEKIDIWKQP